MYKSELYRIVVGCCCILCLLALPACAGNNLQETASEEQGGFVKIAPGAYDSADTAIVTAKSEKENKITFFNLTKKKTYTLNYDGTTKFMDKYGSAIAVSQLQEGEAVQIQFLKSEKLLTSLAASSAFWTLNDISKFELDLSAGRILILGEYYTLDDTTVVISNGKQAEFLDIQEGDILQVKGKDHQVYSITIQKGHGYLRLENEEYFVGGWIEVGQKIIQKIEEDMLLVVPEGNYEVYLSHNGIEGTKEVKIERNQETQLDVGDLKNEDLIKYGNLVITVEPSDAKVSIDGKTVDTSRVIKTTYGLHQIMAKAEGYDTVIQYIRVTQDSAAIAISLDEESVRTVSDNSVSASEKTNNDTSDTQNSSTAAGSNTTDNSTTDNSTTEDNTAKDTVSGNNAASTSSTGYKVTIEAPAGAEVYVDGSYVGIVPASFAKKAGSHEITIRKSGYLTRTYTIEVDEEDKDTSYSFSDLTKIE